MLMSSICVLNIDLLLEVFLTLRVQLVNWLLSPTIVTHLDLLLRLDGIQNSTIVFLQISLERFLWRDSVLVLKNLGSSDWPLLPQLPDFVSLLLYCVLTLVVRRFRR